MIRSFIDNAPRLIIALAVLSMSGCSLFGSGGDPLEVLRNKVSSTVHDEERAAAMLAEVDKLDQLLIESAALLSEAARRQRALFSDYDSTPQDFETQLSDLSRKRRGLQEDLLHVHLEFKDKATAEEWEAILPIHTSAISARVNSLVVAAINERS